MSSIYETSPPSARVAAMSDMKHETLLKYTPNFLEMPLKPPWKTHLTVLKHPNETFLKHPWKALYTSWNFFETCLKFPRPCNFLENPLEFPFKPLNPNEIPWKHPWNILELPMEQPLNTLKAFLKHPWNTLQKPAIVDKAPHCSPILGNFLTFLLFFLLDAPEGAISSSFPLLLGLDFVPITAPPPK